MWVVSTAPSTEFDFSLSAGRPGTDYPVLSAVPYTNFYCGSQPYPGFFADMETRCQAWHYCDIDGRQATFLCPNGTQFSQAVFVCDWWFNVRCELSPALYAINSRLYGTPREDPTRPHRLITKELLQNIFVWTHALHVWQCRVHAFVQATDTRL